MRNEMQTEGTEAMLDLRTGKEMVADCLGDTRCGRKGSELRRRNSDKIMSNKGDGPTVRWFCWGLVSSSGQQGPQGSTWPAGNVLEGSILNTHPCCLSVDT